MKLKILAIVIMLIMVGSSFVVSADVKESDSEEINANNNDVVEIKIALLSLGDIQMSNLPIFIPIFDDYQWIVGNKHYKLTISEITEKDVFRGDLKVEKYDLLIIPASEGETFAVKLLFSPLKRILWKKNIADYIESGGGYAGYCMGSYIMAGFEGEPKTLNEKTVSSINIGLSKAKLSNVDAYNPFTSQLFKDPIGIGAYAWFSDNNMSKDIRFCGVPLDIKINKDTPIFDDFIGDTRRMRWIAGEAFIVPENDPDSDITVIGYYPELNISKNTSTAILEWEYTGGALGFLKGFLRYRKQVSKSIDSLYYTPYMATDWKCTGKIIETHNAGKPFMTMETYPNENQARIIICNGHPEFKVWWGGHIENAVDTDDNMLWDGLHSWVNISSYDVEYNYCIIRRHVAWVSKKVPDNDLPPVYGPSEVRDFDSYNQSSKFTIYGNAEESDSYPDDFPYNRNISLDLYYRHSPDNVTWSEWTLYSTDSDGSNGWYWKFDAPEVPAYYQFYSIRHVEYEGYTETEKVPPGPDAIAYAKGE